MKQSCWRCLLLLTAVALAVLVLAEIVPRVLIQSNLEAFAGVEEDQYIVFASRAYFTAHFYVFSEWPARLICTAVRIVEVRRLSPEEVTGRCRYPFEAKVRLYTVFGIPYDTIVVGCDLAPPHVHKPLGP